MTAHAELAMQSMLDALQVDAISLTEHLPGPGLAGRTTIRVVVNVTMADGTPLSGLSTTAFTLRGVAGPGEGRTVPIAELRETAPGIYALSLGLSPNASHGPSMLAVSVHDRATDRSGRRLVRIDP